MSSDTESPLRIVTMFRFEPQEVERLREAARPRRMALSICANQGEFLEQLAPAEIVLGDLARAELEHAPLLKWIQSGRAGVEDLACQFQGTPVVVTNCAGTFAPGIAETAFGMLLSLTRGLSRYYIPQFLRREWRPAGDPKSNHYCEISGRTLGIVGLGGIGCAVAKTAHHGFNMRVLATDARLVEKPEYVTELHEPSWFAEMVPQADVLVAAAPLTAQTERMFDAAVFRRMKPTAYFLALSRGMLFDDLALVQALKEGWIAGAALDVFPQEPPPPEHPIFDCPNVVMSMHTSGWGPDRQVRLLDLFCENLRRYASGLPLINVVDKKSGY